MPLSALLFSFSFKCEASPILRLLPNAVVRDSVIRVGDVTEMKADGRETLKSSQLSLKTNILLKDKKIPLRKPEASESPKPGGDEASRIAALELGPTPPPGRERNVSLSFLRIVLQQNQFDPKLIDPSSSSVCLVTRDSQILTSDQLLQAASDYLQTQYKSDPSKPVIEPTSKPFDLVLPTGALTTTFEVLNGDYDSPTRSVRVHALVDGQESGRSDVYLRVRRFIRVAVSNARIARGAMVSPDMIHYEEKDSLSQPEDVLREGDSLDNLQATEMISPNMTITHRMMSEPPLIHRGDRVTLRARIGRIEVSTLGIALEDGAENQWIRIRNETSGQESRAKVINATTTEISL